MVSMKNKTTLAVISLILLMGMVYFLNGKEKQTESGPIKISALLSLTGDASAWGENSKKGIQIAVDEINAQGGIHGRRIEVNYQDTAADAKKAVSAYQAAVNIDHADAIIGPLQQNEGVSVISLIDQLKTPTVIPGFIPLKDRKDTSNPLIIWMDAEVEAEQIAEKLFSEGIKTVAVISSQDIWESTVSDAFTEKFKKLGGTITIQEKVLTNAADVKLSIVKMLATKPDAIFLGTYYQFVHATKELHNLGYTGKLYGIEVDDYLANETYGWSKGIKFISPDLYTGEFTKKFESLYGTKPGLPAGQSYDAAHILFSILRENGTDKQRVLQAMRDFKSHEGVSGALKILPDGRTSLPTAIFEIGEKGVITKVEDVK